MIEKLINEFSNPGSEYRGAPFWAWNDKLEPEELRRQIRIMKEMGFGGFFMHSRTGLKTPYLSDEWFECVNLCIDEAGKAGMNAWLYDEDRWPSGSAGGLVTKNPEYQRKFLLCEEISDIKKFGWGDDLVAAFIGTVKVDGVTVIRMLKQDEKNIKLDSGNVIISFRIMSEKKSEWFNGQTDLDTMNQAAVKEFIKVTHEKYKKYCGREFGHIVKGIFTDEPAYGFCMGECEEGGYCIPWTGGLADFFEERYGYDLIPHLPEVVYNLDIANNLKTRYNFLDCITSLFVSSFSKQIGKWCEENNLAFAGHIAWEDTLSTQAYQTGSCMRFYEHMHMPGMDLLTEEWRSYDVAKQVSSIARQFDRKWRLTETYGCTGWDFPFYGHKALGDWQLALGINFRSHHLYWYTMKGQCKRDYPASIGHQSPWWNIYPIVEDYFARLNVILSHGSEVRDLLVIHPVESMWLKVRKGWWKSRKKNSYDRKFTEISDWLLANHLDFDYGEEEILSRHSSINKRDGIAILSVGKADYRTIVVPRLITMRNSTLELIKKFKQAGGNVIFIGNPPEYVDAVSSQEPRKIAGKCLQMSRVQDIAKECPRRVNITNDKGKEISCVLYQLREDDESFYLFICNTGHSPQQLKRGREDERYQIPFDVKTSARKEKFPKVIIKGFEDCAGHPQEWLPQTGERFSAQAKRLNDEKWEISTSLPELGSRVFVVPKKTTKWLPTFPLFGKSKKNPLKSSSWDFTLSEHNVFVLDCPRWRKDGGEWLKETEILKIDDQLRADLGLSTRNGSSMQPWVEKELTSRRIKTELEYSFEIVQKMDSSLCLAIENLESFKIYLNGSRIYSDTVSSWWIEPSLKCVSLNPALLRIGKNVILLKYEYAADDDGLESAFLLGNFGVYFKNNHPHISTLPHKLNVGSWTDQGLPFFSGAIAYCKKVELPELEKGERLYVCIPEYIGTAVKIIVNNKTAGIIAWKPNEVDITELVSGEKFELRIEVVGHRRNSHGPLHYYKKNPMWISPDEFISTGTHWKDNYQIVSCGLMDDPILEIKRPTDGTNINVCY